MHIVYSKASTEKLSVGKDQEQATNKKVTVKAKPVKPKSIYTIAREEKFKKAALKKYADRIKAIQVYFPDWEPEI